MSIRGAGRELVLVGLFTVLTVDADDVKDVTGVNGLEVLTRQGRSLEHLGYGGSLIGSVTGDLRGTSVARAIRSWMLEVPTRSSRPTSAEVRRSVRPAVVWLIPLLAAAFSGVASIVHVATT